MNDYKTIDFYNEIIKNEYLKDKIFYCDLGNYEGINNKENFEPGYKFDDLYGNVDVNYLKMINLKVYNNKNELIDVNDFIDKEVYIFPKEYKFDKRIVINKHNEQIKKANKRNKHILKIYENPSIYYYDNQSIPSFSPNFKEVDSPVLKTLDRNNVYATIYENDLALFGMNFETPFKILVDDDAKKIKEIINDIGYKTSFVKEKNIINFVSYKDYNEDTIKNINENLKKLYLFVSGLGILFTFTKIQHISLYTISKQRMITVKRYLGYSFFRIYKEVYLHSFLLFVINLILLLIAYLKLMQNSLNILLIVALTMFIVDIIITTIIVFLNYRLKLIKNLKGGYNI